MLKMIQSTLVEPTDMTQEAETMDVANAVTQENVQLEMHCRTI